ncbi:hypothetical protein GE21DRAFT_1209376 [Neurospora crassa]|nr:hypothetical protein GE21DRAFT_1209376 [Neurospora crassa]
MPSYNFQISIPSNMASFLSTLPVTYSVHDSILTTVGLFIWITISVIGLVLTTYDDNARKYHEEHIRLLYTSKLIDIESRTITLMQKIHTGDLELQRRMTKAHEQCHWCSHMVPGTRTPRTQGAQAPGTRRDCKAGVELEQDSTRRRWDGFLSRGCTRDEFTTQWYSGKGL